MRYGKTVHGFLELEISDNALPDSFVELAERICAGLDGRIVERVDAYAESYWDMAVDNHVVTLHFHGFIGTRAYANDKESEYIIRKIGDFLGLDDTPL